MWDGIVKVPRVENELGVAAVATCCVSSGSRDYSQLVETVERSPYLVVINIARLQKLGLRSGLRIYAFILKKM